MRGDDQPRYLRQFRQTLRTRRFLTEHVPNSPGEVPFAQRCDYRLLINDAAPRSVDKNAAAWETSNLRSSDEMASLVA